MKNKLMKREHHKMRKFIREFNNSLMSDTYLGLNRFRIDFDRMQWYEFEDKSGGQLEILITITDKYTENKASFFVDNYDYKRRIFEYTNDFMIRCSSGHYGHYPPLHYVVYDIHKVIPYSRDNDREIKIEDGIIDKYNWIAK